MLGVDACSGQYSAVAKDNKPMPPVLNQIRELLLRTITNAAQAEGRPIPSLLAVSKTQTAEKITLLAETGQRAFGENYVQEALVKIRELADLDLEWHLIGPLQSNKCKEVAEYFDWVQSIDREKIIEPLHRFRPVDKAPLNVLIQVNVDGEASKSGCAPEQVGELAKHISAHSRLRLRGLMSIGAPYEDFELRRASFQRMRALFEQLQRDYPGIDTLSMGMSEDFELAIAEGASMVRVGSRLFGPRPAKH
jgi:PLP dependent protein